jgi:probable HAF family extracellular repeat protein
MKKSTVWGVLVGALLVHEMVCAVEAAGTRYRLTNLGSGIVTSVAKDGTVTIGSVLTPTGQQAAILPSTMLGTLPDGTSSQAIGVHHGTIVGYSSTGLYGSLTHAFTYTAATGMRDLGTLGAPALFSAATSIATDIGGYADNPTQTAIAPTLWLEGTAPLQLTTLGGADGHVDAVSLTRFAVGDSETATGETHATLWAPDGTPHDLHPPGLGGFSFAFDVNSQGVTVGMMSAGGPSRGFVWLPTAGMLPLPPLPQDVLSIARSVNDAGDIVGESYAPGPCADCPSHRAAVLWDEGQPIDLNTQLHDGEGWVLMRAVGITEAGQIVGTGTFQGQPQSWLLTPDIAQAQAQAKRPGKPVKKVK